MRKTAISMCSYVLCMSAFGGFFRWIQNMSAFEPETGLMIHGSIWSKLTLVVLLVAVAGIFFLARRLWYKDYYPAQTFEALFAGDEYWNAKMAKIFSGLMLIGAVVLILLAQYHVYHSILRTLALLGALTAWAFMKLVRLPYDGKSPNMVSALASVPVLLYCYWLLVSYRTNAAVPSVWRYGLEILAICASIMAMFYVAGYGFHTPKPYHALAWLNTGALLSLVTITDSRLLGLQIMLLAGAGMQLYLSWMIISTMQDQWPEDVEETAGEAADGVEAPQAE